MSWENEIYAVYDKALRLTKESVMLLPISHSTAKAQIEVRINTSGEFLGANIIENESDAVTVIPVTEDSGARANGISPHPFADKLIYIAGDYCEYCKAKKGDDDKFTAYIEQLASWKNSDYSHISVNALYAYLSKGTLIHDLISARILAIDTNGKLTDDKIQKITQSDCFIRFKVIGVEEERTWLDNSLYDSFIAFSKSCQNKKSMCYATGGQTFCTYKHPSKVLNAGDKGKLFSANDETGFTFRGRFLDKEQAVSIGYEFSQKMHNALKWLIARQGISIGNLTFVVWNSALSKLPKIFNDSKIIIDDNDDLDMDFDPLPETFETYRGELKTAVFGSRSELDFNDKVMILALDEATTGRISVNMYTELQESEFYENVTNWHINTAWNRYSFTKKADYIGSFALPMIAEYTYGVERNGKIECDSKIKNETIIRLIPCVTEGRNIPRDIIQQLVNRASRRTAYDKTWNTLLEVTCGMIRKSMNEKGEEITMALDENCTDRSYLFGRLLALAEVSERAAYQKGEDRPTNAERFFEKFSSNPLQTWGIIKTRLIPYQNRLDIRLKIYYQNIYDDIMQKFDVGSFADNSRLSPLYLLGYSHQRYALYHSDKNKDNSKED